MAIACSDAKGACLALIDFFEVLYYIQNTVSDIFLVQVRARKATYTLPRCRPCWMLSASEASLHAEMAQYSSSDRCQRPSKCHNKSVDQHPLLSRTNRSQRKL